MTQLSDSKLKKSATRGNRFIDLAGKQLAAKLDIKPQAVGVVAAKLGAVRDDEGRWSL